MLRRKSRSLVMGGAAAGAHERAGAAPWSAGELKRLSRRCEMGGPGAGQRVNEGCCRLGFEEAEAGMLVQRVEDALRENSVLLAAGYGDALLGDLRLRASWLVASKE